MARMPPALAATATPRILELLSSLKASPGRVLELGFAGIHAAPLELAGWEVVVVEPDPAFRARAEARAGTVAESPEGRFDAVVAPAGQDLTGIDADRVVVVERDGSVREGR
ncbi:MAG: hypothetical protein ACXVZN_11220 [Gaiellaceae bacterium]